MNAVQLGNGITTSWSYDLDERITQITSGSILSRSYGYSLRDQITANGTRSFGYDDMGRLISDQPNGGAETTYSYDPNGNRLTRVRGTRSESYSHGAYNNQLNQVVINDNGNQSTRSIGRDLNGGTTADSLLFTTANEPSSGVTFARSGALANLPTYYDLQVDERANHLFHA